MTTLRFDDFAALDAAVSDEFGPWGEPRQVTQQMIDEFAEVTGDRQWIHVDVERAKAESPFGGPIAHGFLTLSLLPALAPPGTVVTGHSAAVNYGSEGLRFLSPVPAGSSVHARSRLVSAVQHKSGGTLVTSEIAVHVVGSEKPSLLYKMQILYMG